LFITEDATSICGSKTPMDSEATEIGAGVADTRAAAQFGESGIPIATEALARPETGLKFGGIKPTAVFRGVV
jgi:hypothetical protein